MPLVVMSFVHQLVRLSARTSSELDNKKRLKTKMGVKVILAKSRPNQRFNFHLLKSNVNVAGPGCENLSKTTQVT